MNMLILGLSVRRPEVENVSYGVTVYHINTHIQLELQREPSQTQVPIPERLSFIGCRHNILQMRRPGGPLNA